jgi:hypothetical protein
MRVLSPVACMLLALTGAPACGGDDDDDGSGGTGVDAATGGGADAAPVGGTGLGAQCTATIACPDTAPDCVTLSATATEGYCTKQCATTPTDDGNTIPDTSHAACDAINDSTATAACFVPLADVDPAGMTVWECGLGCGVVGPDDFGQCPSNMTCDQPMATQPGICFPPG